MELTDPCLPFVLSQRAFPHPAVHVKGREDRVREIQSDVDDPQTCALNANDSKQLPAFRVTFLQANISWHDDIFMISEQAEFVYFISNNLPNSNKYPFCCFC